MVYFLLTYHRKKRRFSLHIHDGITYNCAYKIFRLEKKIMDKEQALESFFKSLKISLKNASIYTSQHPAFKRSVKEGKETIDTLLNYLSPIRIGITSDALLVDGKHFEKARNYEELAQIFHLHMIKSLEIQEGITPEELTAFITKVYQDPKEILKKGGLNRIFEEENITHLSVEELDYSPFLTGEGEEVKDVWTHLLQEAVKKEDVKKISDLANSFEKVAAHFKIEELLENEQFRTNIDKFLSQLKNMEEDKFRRCSKDLLKSLIRNKEIAREDKIRKARKFFKELSEEDVASSLLEEILTNEEFNALSFQLFSELTEKRRHQKIADSFADQFQKVSLVHRSPKVRQKIKDLMTGDTSEIIPETYRQTLSSLLKDMATEEKIHFDVNHLQRNYRYFLLSLFAEEEKKKKVVSTLEKILIEWESIVQERDFVYLKSLVDVLAKRRKELAFEPVLSKTNTKIINFIVDEAVREHDAASEVEPLINYLKGGFLSSRPLLIKIFEENKVNTQILRYFFELHPDSHILFKKNLRVRSFDTEFLKTIIKSLKKIDTPASQDILNDVLSFGNDSIKMEALKALQKSSTHNVNRLLRILEGGSTPLKKEALEILARNSTTRENALAKIFDIPSSFGSKNRILIEHIRIIRELELKEAAEYLITFSKKKFVWNKKLREEALKVLREWDAGKD